MRKKNKEYRRKFTTNTYMREALSYDIVVVKEDDFFVTIKKYKEMTNPVRLSVSNRDYINNNYYLVEFTPLNDNYNIRFYYSDKKEYIEFYCDITLENGVKYKIPYYIDLYLDILHNPKDDSIYFDDEHELKEALDNKIISKKDYELAYKVGNRIKKEIENKTNRFMNMNIVGYINRYFD